MTDRLTHHEQLPLSSDLEAKIAVARELAAAARAENTRRCYRSGWQQFERYCREQHALRAPLPADPAIVALFLSWLSQNERKPATLRARCAAIAYHHRRAGVASPCDHPFVKDVLEGAQRLDAGRDHGRATVSREDLEALLLRLPDPRTSLELRDRALALLTFSTSRRRSEIAALDLSHLTFRRQNDHDFLFVRIVKSKTDQHGNGTTVAVPRLAPELESVCAVHALERWLDELSARAGRRVLGSGPVFRAFSITGNLKAHRIEPRAVAAALKRLYAQAGYAEEHTRAIAAHSLRRGFITSADAAGATAAEIMAVTGHRDRRMLDRYTNHEKTKNPPLLRIFGLKR